MKQQYASPARAVVDEREAFSYVSRNAGSAYATPVGKQDSGILRVWVEPATQYAVSAGSLEGSGRERTQRYGQAAEGSLFNGYSAASLQEARYEDWEISEPQAQRLLGRIATPGAWAAVAVVVLAVVAFVLVTPAFASTGSLSRYSDLRGVGISKQAEVVIDASSAPPPAAPQAEAPASVVPAPAGSYSVIGAPSTSVAQIERVLEQYGSPAAGLGQKLYDLGVQYGIDPAYALAFFVHESGCGTQGVARFTKSLGNIRVTEGWEGYSGYRKYSSWEQGFEDWYKLITDLYIGGWGLKTVDAIVPVYAPAGDGNNPAGYIASVKSMVDDWRGK